MTGALNRGIDGVNYVSGAELPNIEDPFLGSRSLARGGTYLGIPDPQSVLAVTPAERIARGVGEGAAYAVAPATVVRGGAALAGRDLPPLAQAAFGRINSVREAGRDMAIGASAGATGKTARELVPEAWKPTAEIAGGLLGGVAAAGARARTVEWSWSRIGNAQPERHPQRAASIGVAHASSASAQESGGNAVAQSGIEKRRSQLAINSSVGRAFEIRSIADVSVSTGVDIQPQITMRSSGPSGLSVRVDAIGRDPATGRVRIWEFKSSLTAPLTRNQTQVFPEFEMFGGIIRGDGKPPWVGGTMIPPTRVQIVRGNTQ